MKSIIKALSGLIVATFLVTSAHAQRANESYKALNSPEEIQSMKKGDKYGIVCMECKTLSVTEVADSEEAAALCHNGGSIHCPSCKKDFKITHGPRGKVTSSKVVYVNDAGKECMFVVAIKD